MLSVSKVVVFFSRFVAISDRKYGSFSFNILGDFFTKFVFGYFRTKKARFMISKNYFN